MTTNEIRFGMIRRSYENFRYVEWEELPNIGRREYEEKMELSTLMVPQSVDPVKTQVVSGHSVSGMGL